MCRNLRAELCRRFSYLPQLPEVLRSPLFQRLFESSAFSATAATNSTFVIVVPPTNSFLFDKIMIYSEGVPLNDKIIFLPHSINDRVRYYLCAVNQSVPYRPFPLPCETGNKLFTRSRQKLFGIHIIKTSHIDRCKQSITDFFRNMSGIFSRP